MDAVTRDRIYDHSLAVLRDTALAEESLALVEGEVAKRNPTFTDPAHRDVWVLALARFVATGLARTRRPGDGDTDTTADDATAPVNPFAEEERIDPGDRAALQAVIWEELGRLDAVDRAVLDLHLRQGLTGDNLARALGLDPARSYEMVSDLRREQEDNLRHALAARTGSDPAALPNPLALYASMPRHEAPDRVATPVDDAATVAIPAIPAFLSVGRWTEEWPPPVGDGRPSPVLPLAAGAAIAVVVALIVALLSWVTGAGTGDGTQLDASSDTTTASGGATTTAPLDIEDTTTTSPARSSTTTSSSTTSTTSTTAPAGGRVEVAATSYDFGSDQSSVRIDVRNRGGSPVDVTITTNATWITTSPTRTRLDAGATLALAIGIDRATAPEGRPTGQVRVAAPQGQGGGTIAITATVGQPPVIDTVTAEPGRFSTRGCAPDSAIVRAQVTDDRGVRAVTLHWTDPAGRQGSAPMTDVGGGRYEGRLGPFDDAGNASFRVSATDNAGATATSGTGSVTVDACPAPTTP